jgi:acyl-coenzyme A thioesterase PaaI-like protein
MHACALATAAEYASGLCVLSALGIENKRLIMSDLAMTYRRRAESACLATALLPQGDLELLKGELEREGRGSFVLHSTVRDAKGEVVADAEITWHVKLTNG